MWSAASSREFIAVAEWLHDIATELAEMGAKIDARCPDCRRNASAYR